MSAFTKQTFEIRELMVANRATENGRIYSLECINKIAEEMNKNVGSFIVQEMNISDRERKKIPVYEPVYSRAMATAVGAMVDGGALHVACETRPNRDGKKLSGIISGNGLDSIEFMPVGYGDVVKVGDYQEVRNYTLKYIAIEPKL